MPLNCIRKFDLNLGYKEEQEEQEEEEQEEEEQEEVQERC